MSTGCPTKSPHCGGTWAGLPQIDTPNFMAWRFQWRCLPNLACPQTSGRLCTTTCSILRTLLARMSIDIPSFRRLEFKSEKSTEEEWRFSTPTFLGNHTLVRVVNYYVSDDGSYHVSKGEKVNTRLMIQEPEEYLSVEWSERFRSTLSVPEGEASFHHPDAYVLGLEDTRLVTDSHRAGTIYTLSASAEYSRDAGTMNQVLGILDMPTKTLWIQGVIRGPQENRHDKNWVFVGGLDHVVYDWYPTVQIGSIDVKALALELHTHIPSPNTFRDMRGSTNGVLYNHEWWFVTHSVIYRPQQMRKYLHYLVVLNDDLTSISRYSLPFTFERGSDVEYCLGLKVDATALTFGYSVRDRSTRVMTVPWGDIGQLFP